MLFFALLVIAPSTKGNAATLKDDNGYKNVCMNASCIRIGDNIYMQDDLNIVQFNLKNKKFKTIFKGISAKKAYYIIVGHTGSWRIYTTSGKPIAHLFGSTVSVY